MGGFIMQEKNRTFKQLEKQKTFEELNCFAKEVTEKYATSPIEYSQSNAARDNHLTVKGLRDLMDYAIVTAQVSLNTAILVKNKAIQNQQRKAREAGGSSIVHHEDLIRQRENFLMTAFSRTETRKIAEDIACNPSKPLHYFTKKYRLESDRMIKLLLKKSIVEDIVTDEVMELIIKRSYSTEKANQVFQEFRKQREKYKSSH